jgi:predicted transcriptional regulator
MEVHFTPEQEAQLLEMASFRAAVREGIAQLDRGEFIEEEEMNAIFEQMLRS